MAKPDDMILPLLREMRALHGELGARIAALDLRFGRIDDSMSEAVDIFAERAAAVRASRRRPPAGSSA